MNRLRTILRTTSVTRSLVLASSALVVGVGGTATAATLITGADIQDGSVYSRDIADGMLTGTDGRDESLSPTDFTGSLQGPAGPAGRAGPQGPAGVSGLQYVTNGITVGGGQTSAGQSTSPAWTRTLSARASVSWSRPHCPARSPL